MDWIVIILLLVFGLGFIIAEIIFIPGTTLVGLLGLVFTIAGIVISYLSYGSSAGTWVLLLSLFIGVGTLVYSFKSGIWNKFALKGSSNSKFNEGTMEELQVGEEGLTVSSLRPIGKAEFNEQTYEVRTLGNALDPGTRVRIISIKENKIYVEPIIKS